MIAAGAVERDVVVVSCAVSAGIHAALAPEHLADGQAAGLGFLGSGAILAAVAVAVTYRPSSAAFAATAALLAGLVVSYGLAVTSGLALVHPEPEPIGALAVATKAIEIAGLLAACRLLLRGRPSLAAIELRQKGPA